MRGKCIRFQGYIGPNGYGQIRVNGKLWNAHKWAAHCAHGPCPEGMVVRHKCDHRWCINPDHLEYGTQRDNLIDRRERHRYRKLTREDAEQIKAYLADGWTCTALAAKYGVSITMVSYIKTGKQWANS